MAGIPHESDELFVPIEAEARGKLESTGLDAPRFFPSPLVSTEDGLVCVGGRLTPDWLLDAYRHGIFPWPVWDDEPMAWWSLDPRAVLEFDHFHISRRLQRTLRSGRFQATCNRDFAGVIHGCASAEGRVDNTWLTPAMIDAYLEMHRLGHAHSIEVWQDGELVGGTYGIAIGGLFAAESMFHRATDASKVALAYLMCHLQERGFVLVDVQQWTPHTGRMGAVVIPRVAYLQRVALATRLSATFGGLLAGDPLEFVAG